MKKNIKKILPYIINITIVLSIFLITLIITKTSPFGNIILGKSNSITQYKPMIYNFITSLKHGILDIYNFNNGLGNPFLFNYIHYLISPLNIVGILFKNGDIMYLSIILIKISFTAIFTTYYAKKHNCSNLTTFIATISYVFSSWFLAYYYNIMWLDTFMIFPLFQYGLEQLIKNKKIYIYIFSLAYICITNTTTALSVLIYTFIYYIIRNFFYEEKNIKEKFKNSIYFLFSTIITFILITLHIYILLNIKKQTGIEFSNIIEPETTTKIFDIIRSLFYSNITPILQKQQNLNININTNTIILISLFYFFINKNIKTKDKIYTLIGITIILLTLLIKEFNYLLNIFNNIKEQLYHYSYIIIFLSIIVFIQNSKKINIKKDKKKMLITSLILTILLLINYKNMETNILIFNLIFILAYSIIIIFYNEKTYYKILIGLLLILQTLYASYICIPNNIEKEYLTYNNFQTEPLKYRVNTIDENDFINKNMYTNENSTYLFSYITYNHVLNTINNLGCRTDKDFISCHKDNQLFNMLFNIKNKYYLEKIYSVDKNITKVFLDEMSVKNSQEDLIIGMTGIKDIFNKTTLNATIEDDISTFKTDESFYLIDVPYEDTTINYVQSYKEFTYQNTNKNILEKVDIYTINDKTINEIYNKLKDNQIKYTHYSNSHIEGTINVEDNQIIFTSIPYDESWEIKIDGKIVKPTMILESLIGIECKPGKHTITMKYKTNYTIPIIISLITLLGLIISIFIPKKKNEN